VIAHEFSHSSRRHAAQRPPDRPLFGILLRDLGRGVLQSTRYMRTSDAAADSGGIIVAICSSA